RCQVAHAGVHGPREGRGHRQRASRGHGEFHHRNPQSVDARAGAPPLSRFAAGADRSGTRSGESRMAPSLALLIFAAGIAGLLWIDRDQESKISPALWLPVIWLSLLCSRSVSQWLGASSVTDSGDQYVEGSPLDRNILTGFIVVGLI